MAALRVGPPPRPHRGRAGRDRHRGRADGRQADGHGRGDARRARRRASAARLQQPRRPSPPGTPRARPVPVTSARAGQAAVSELCDVIVVDVAGPRTQVLRPSMVWALAQEREWVVAAPRPLRRARRGAQPSPRSRRVRSHRIEEGAPAGQGILGLALELDRGPRPRRDPADRHPGGGAPGHRRRAPGPHRRPRLPHHLTGVSCASRGKWVRKAREARGRHTPNWSGRRGAATLAADRPCRPRVVGHGAQVKLASTRVDLRSPGFSTRSTTYAVCRGLRRGRM